jgi:hypothetical protein
MLSDHIPCARAGAYSSFGAGIDAFIAQRDAASGSDGRIRGIFGKVKFVMANDEK